MADKTMTKAMEIHAETKRVERAITEAIPTGATYEAILKALNNVERRMIHHAFKEE